MVNYSCRFYENEYPNIGEIVVGRITKVTDLGVYLDLLEYNNLEGLIVIGELTKKRIRNIQQHVKIGKIDVGFVIRVDKDKRYIDLSRKKVTKEDQDMCLKKYAINKISHNVMVLVAKKTNVQLLKLYEDFGWKKVQEHGTLYNYFSKIMNNIENVENNEFGKILFECIKMKFTVSKVKVRADIDVTCAASGGITAIKDALTSVKNVYPKIELHLIKPPTFSIIINTDDKEKGINIIKSACNLISENIRKLGGTFAVSNEAKVYGEKNRIDLLVKEMNDLAEYNDSEEDSNADKINE
ncbi:subunit alpha of translation initiation factor 2 [Hamiltosporidium tvaerminnensis]|uniref:Subunit alpha of translation initiation factor 2 n=2 Tax=Hamiltosporidium TaxID=1176354 RepID=A0A4Q9LUY0_9MICR|nr:hypothetical protein LUQ84_000797 [Hamiltosporidium tvaerminnensis]TBT99643.1 subunit alpha of translation initiation factor 2 [Hamiltosporidium tvaerminnensis]TBU00868.1 subunit alpha of translation initiation factor 2 [Hamiltosporidium magnivora]TBU11425.1 subunit alpha of translation initiation factor 2 [Hamiltosporidium tvaerminnensis]